MTVGLDAPTALRRPGLPAPEERVTSTDALEDIIAAHRTALLELAPHQAWRSVREDTGWHMAELGLLLCHRDAQAQTQTQSAARGVGSRGRQEESTGPNRPTR